MKKVYQKPEFEVICQNQANAKFFVASFENGGLTTGTPPTEQDATGVTSSQASSYGNDAGSFNF